jgi:putative nucleotidyltransferase with HDIG domain
MSDESQNIRLAGDLVRHFAASVKVQQLYAPDHPIVMRAVAQFGRTLERAHVDLPEVVIGFVDQQVVVNGLPLLDALGAAEIGERLRAAGIERISIDRGVSAHELAAFARLVSTTQARRDEADDDAGAAALSSEHIHVGRIRVEQRTDADAGKMGAILQSYRNAVAGAEDIWTQAQAESKLDPGLAFGVVDSLATAILQNQRAMTALTALYEYDNYTFTHMVNVSVLTMAQAQSLGIDGPLLRQFGMAGLMHDIGKIRTPGEILGKPGRLTDEEMSIMMQHPVNGAEMLRLQIELPPITAVVAFEHHLRLDGTGYPAGVASPSLNLATQLCSIGDVYDAMRVQRVYQRAFPTDRIVAVLQQNDGTRFDQRLVRRFSQLMGIYPVGNLVRLDNGTLAVVLRIHAPDPSRPAVRVIADPDNKPLARPYDVALWVGEGPAGSSPRIVSPVAPADVGIDPLPYLDETAA